MATYPTMRGLIICVWRLFCIVRFSGRVQRERGVPFLICKGKVPKVLDFGYINYVYQRVSVAVMALGPDGEGLFVRKLCLRSVFGFRGGGGGCLSPHLVHFGDEGLDRDADRLPVYCCCTR